MCRTEVPSGLGGRPLLVRQNAFYIADTNNAGALGRVANILVIFVMLSPIVGVLSLTTLLCFIGYSMCVAAYYNIFPL
jgi:hypothetical protein